MGKRKFKEEVEEEEAEMPLLPNGHGHPSSSSLAFTAPTSGGGGPLNGALNMTNGDDSDEQHQAVWLVRKPTNMPMEALHNIHFSRKPSSQCQTFSATWSSSSGGTANDDAGGATSTGQQTIECLLKKPARPMLRVISDRKRNFDEKVPMTQGSSLRGVVWINNIEMERTTTKTTGNDGEEDNKSKSRELPQLDVDEDDDNGSTVPCSSSIQIGSIRRKPVVDEHALKERLKAFGIKESSGNRSCGGVDGGGVKKTRRK